MSTDKENGRGNKGASWIVDGRPPFIPLDYFIPKIQKHIK
jgi:hypothetical protein